MEFIPIWIFFLDILVTLNTSYHSKGILIKNKRSIAKNYIRKEFILDLITLSPTLFSSDNTIATALFLLRIIKIKKLFKKIKDNFVLDEKFYNSFEIFKLLFMVIYLAHVCACVWHYVAIKEIEKGYSKTWLHYNNLYLETKLVRYVNSLYYSVLTMATVAFIETNSHTEKTISIFLVLILSGTFAYSVSNLGVILQDLFKDDNELKFIIIFFFYKLNLNFNLILNI